MDIRQFALLLSVLTLLLFIPRIPRSLGDLLSSRSILLALLAILALLVFSVRLLYNHYPSPRRLAAANAIVLAVLLSSIPTLLSCQKLSTLQKLYTFAPYALLLFSTILLDYIVFFLPPRCPNCGHEMIRIGETFVCPECEYHSDADPEKGTFR